MPEENLAQTSSPAVITGGSETESPKKAKTGKIIAAVFGILLLVGGVAAGVFLVQREQEIRERAASGSACNQHPDCVLLDEPGNSGSYTANRPITHLFITAKEYHRFDSSFTDDGCYRVEIEDNFLSWERYGSGPDCKDVSNVQVWLGERQPPPTPTATPSPAPTSTPTPTLPPQATPTPTPLPTPTPTLPPDISAQCHSVSAYDTSWNLLSANDLSSLKQGDVVRFAVAGSTSSGFFDKAKFTINGVTRPEVTSKKPGSDEFYDEYIIPAGVTTFTVSAQIHHSELGWF